MPTRTASMQMSSATFEHRRYTGRKNADGSDHFLSGVAFDPDSGSRAINGLSRLITSEWNGTPQGQGRKYKRVIRILKRLRDRMQDDGNAPSSKTTQSFLIDLPGLER